MNSRRRAADELVSRCPNSDMQNLELEHRRVSKSHRMITRSCIALDPPIDASGLDGVLYRAGPPSRPPRFQCHFASSESSGEIAARIVGMPVPPLLHQRLELGVVSVGQHDA